MSYSSLFGIKKDCTGEELAEYKNSWWFSPVVWNVLSDKVLPRNFMGSEQGTEDCREWCDQTCIYEDWYRGNYYWETEYESKFLCMEFEV